MKTEFHPLVFKERSQGIFLDLSDTMHNWRKYTRVALDAPIRESFRQAAVCFYEASRQKRQHNRYLGEAKTHLVYILVVMEEVHRSDVLSEVFLQQIVGRLQSLMADIEKSILIKADHEKTLRRQRKQATIEQKDVAST